MQKLIRRYFKESTATLQTQEGVKLRAELATCWETYGVNHPKCDRFVEGYDRAWVLDLAFRHKFEMQVKQYPAYFEKMFPPHVNKDITRGRQSMAATLRQMPFRPPKY